MPFNEKEQPYVDYIIQMIELGHAKLINKYGKITAEFTPGLDHAQKEAIVKGAFILGGIPSVRISNDLKGDTINLSEMGPLSPASIASNLVTLGKIPAQFMTTIRDTTPVPAGHSRR